MGMGESEVVGKRSMQFVKLPLAAYDMAAAEVESTNTNAQHGAIQRPNTKAASLLRSATAHSSNEEGELCSQTAWVEYQPCYLLGDLGPVAEPYYHPFPTCYEKQQTIQIKILSMVLQ